MKKYDWKKFADTEIYNSANLTEEENRIVGLASDVPDSDVYYRKIYDGANAWIVLVPVKFGDDFYIVGFFEGATIYRMNESSKDRSNPFRRIIYENDCGSWGLEIVENGLYIIGVGNDEQPEVFRRGFKIDKNGWERDLKIVRSFIFDNIR